VNDQPIYSTLLSRIVWIREALELGDINEALRATADLEEDLAEREAA
jgi:hypothetical protein